MKSKRSVFLGNFKGETPRKLQYFSRFDAPDAVGAASPNRAEQQQPPKSALSRSALPPMVPEEVLQSDPRSPSPTAASALTRMPARPTTSRGKARPSPDEFADYVQSSPPRAELDAFKVIVFDKGGVGRGSTDDDDEDDDEDDHRVGAAGVQAVRRLLAASPDDNSPAQADEGEFGDEASYDDDAYTTEQLDALRGCWLFGAALSV